MSVSKTTRMISEGLRDLIRWLLTIPLLLLGFIRRWIHFRRLANRFPGPPSYPLVGSFFNLLPTLTSTATQVIYDFIDIMKQFNAGQIDVGFYRIFFLTDPQDVQCYLLNSGNQFKPSLEYGTLSQVIGKGLTTENGLTWKRHNKILLPTFHREILNYQLPIFDKKCDVFIEVLRKHADSLPFDMKEIVEFLLIDIVFESLFEYPSDNLRKPDHELLGALTRIRSGQSYRISHPWLLPDFIYYQVSSLGKKQNNYKKIYYRVCETVLRYREKLLDEQEETKENYQEPYDEKKRYCPLDAMIHHMKKGELNRNEVTEEMVTLMMAGFDTTYISVLLTLYLISNHPHVQEKLFLEIREIFDKNGSTEITANILQQMPYLDMVQKESLRLYPSVWIVLRMTGVDTPLATSDLVVPAGAVMAISPKNMHMNPKLFPDPEVFDPERFSLENSKERHPYAFLPFSLGKRGCIGKRFAQMGMKTIICKVLWNYELLPDSTYTPLMEWGVTAEPSNGMRVKLVKRKNSPKVS